ncbi:hypothetical protein [Cognatishimia sp. WU-CL00825]|uniref:hypothetical protein n=1 Tax=Cognatishimia sp. WU-CL00825 TaxID=3127658 RepID=UPI0033653760
MSNTDSFIDEVTEEVRRDKLFGTMRKYGWIAVVAVVAVVGGASWNEYQKSQTVNAARATGDALLEALGENEAAARVTALQNATLSSAQADVVRQFLLSAEQAGSGSDAEAAQTLDGFLSTSPDAALIYKSIAELKALMLGAESIPAEERRARLEAMSQPGLPLALLASEQLALAEIADGQSDAAISRLQAIILDAGVSSGLRQRSTQLIVALGGVPETLPSLSATQ